MSQCFFENFYADLLSEKMFIEKEKKKNRITILLRLKFKTLRFLVFIFQEIPTII